MTPKEKAKELVDKYISFNKNKIAFVYTKESSKICALIAVDEILARFLICRFCSVETTKVKWATQRKFPNGEYKFWKGVAYKKYWIEVKKEIEAL